MARYTALLIVLVVPLASCSTVGRLSPQEVYREEARPFRMVSIQSGRKYVRGMVHRQQVLFAYTDDGATVTTADVWPTVNNAHREITFHFSNLDIPERLGGRSTPSSPLITEMRVNAHDDTVTLRFSTWPVAVARMSLGGVFVVEFGQETPDKSAPRFSNTPRS